MNLSLNDNFIKIVEQELQVFIKETPLFGYFGLTSK